MIVPKIVFAAAKVLLQDLHRLNKLQKGPEHQRVAEFVE
jgi:hypothetical protein